VYVVHCMKTWRQPQKILWSLENRHAARNTADLPPREWGEGEVKTTCPDLTNFSVHAACGRGSILLWRQCRQLQYVMYFRFCGWWRHNGRWREALVISTWVAVRTSHAAATLFDFVVVYNGSNWHTGAKFDVCDCLVYVWAWSFDSRCSCNLESSRVSY